MAEDFSIALSSIQNIKTVKIEGLGVLKVRKLGSGEELQLSLKSRRLSKIYDELGKMDFSKFDATKPDGLKKITALTKKSEALAEEIEEIKRYEFGVYRNLLSDDKNGKVVDVIMNTLTDEERGELFKRVFGIVQPVDVPEPVEAGNE